MDASTITINTKFELDNPSGARVVITDTSVNNSGSYSTILPNGNSQVKGNILAKYGSIIFHGNTIPNWTTPDITRSGYDNVSFFLPLDSLNNVISATYSFLYVIQVLQEKLLTFNSVSVGGPGAQTTSVINVSTGEIAKINAILSDPTKANIKVSFLVGSTIEATTHLISVADSGSGTATLTFASIAVPSYGTISSVAIFADGIYSKEFDYNYENNIITPCLDVEEADCLRAQLTVVDRTNYPAILTSSTRTLQVQYPRYTNGTPVAPPVSTNQGAITIGPNLYTGNYTITLSTQIIITQSDALVVQQTITARVEKDVNCKYSLCCVKKCVVSVFKRYDKSRFEGSQQQNELFMQTFQIIRYKTEFDWDINCGDIDGANRVLRQLSAYLELQGCDCGCDENQESGEPTIIYATVTSQNNTPNLLSWN